MIFFHLPSVQVLLLTGLFLGALTQESTDEPKCEENGINPDDEDPNPEIYEDDSSVMAVFLNKLEAYTGFGSSEKFSVRLDNCGGGECVVNPNGTAIWDARMDLYMYNLMNGTDKKTTLDGCLCYSKDVADYRSCMTDVRNNMMVQLDTILVEKFRAIVESDCSTLVNCVGALSL